LANDGTVKIGTELDQSGFKSGLSGLGSFASKGFSAVGGAAKAMAGITVGALAAVGTGMGALVVSGVKYNAAMEMYTANFSTMLGSEEAAIAKVNELKKMGAATPFEMADLAKATTTLLAFGVSGDKSTGMLQMLGDVSLGNAEKLDRLSNSFGKVQSQGKLTGETAQMMIEAGFNPLKVISETTGESMSALADRMSKGAISADEVTAAFKKATSEGGQFYKGMETASTTFDGLVSTLKDNANSLVGEVVKPISDGLTKTLLPQAIGMVQTLTDAFAKDGIPGLISAAGGVVGQILSGITAQLPAVITMANSFLTTLINALLIQLPTLSAAGTGIITGLLNAMITMIPQLLLLGMGLIVNILDGLALAMPTLIPAAQAAILLIAGILAENLNYILDAGIQILIALMNGIVAALPQLIQTWLDMNAMMIQTIIDNLPAIITAAIQILLALINGLTQAIPQLVAMLPTLIAVIVNTLLANLPAIVTAAIQILLALISGIASAIPQLIAMLPYIITTIVDILMANLPMIITAAIQIIVALIQGLSAAIPQLVTMLPIIIKTIVTTLLNNLPLIIGGAVQIIMAVITGLIQAIPELVRAIPQIVTAIFDAFTKVDWGGIGKNVISGIGNGIKGAAGGLATAATNAANDAISGVKKFLGIRSPSTLFEKEVGKQIPAGAAKGIDKNAGLMSDSAENAASRALAAMQGQAYGRSAGFANRSVSASAATNNQTAFDYKAQAKANAEAMNGMKVEMDGQTVGRVVAPYVDEEMGSMSSLKARYA